MSQPPLSPLPPPSDPELPILTPETVGSDDDLAEAMDEFIAADLEARGRLHEIVQLQEALRSAVDADLWRLVLHIDELIVERTSEVTVALARYAFEAGRRFPLPASGESPS